LTVVSHIVLLYVPTYLSYLKCYFPTASIIVLFISDLDNGHSHIYIPELTNVSMSCACLQSKLHQSKHKHRPTWMA